MKSITKVLVTLMVITLGGVGASAQAQLQNTGVESNAGVLAGASGANPGAVVARDSVPMVNWQAAKTIKRSSQSANGLKAATDLVSVYRPLTLCRLMDTRNLGAPIGGPILAANNGRIVTPAGACGIPTGSVVALSASITVQNTTVNNGGYMTFIPSPSSPLVGTNLVLGPGVEWSGTTANIATASNASFVAFVAQSNVHLVIDINGYYQDMDNLDSDTQMDINGTTSGDLFEITNAGTGSALTLNAFGANGTAIKVNSGSFRVTNAGLDSGTFVFQTKVNTAGTKSAGTGTLCFAASNGHVIDNPHTNADPNAILIITPVSNNTKGFPFVSNTGFIAEYSNATGCNGGAAGNKWTIFTNATLTNNQAWNVMVIKP